MKTATRPNRPAVLWSGTLKLRHYRDAGLMAAVSLAWLLVLSSWLGQALGGSSLSRDNVFFESDTGLWLARVVGPAPGRLPNIEVGAHPAALRIWRPPGRALARVVSLAGVESRRGQLAGRVLVALVAAAGIGSLALAAATFGIEGSRLWMLFGLYLLSTASVVVALPEYFGVSNGLLSLFFAAYVLLSNGVWRRLLLPVLGLLIAGTTVTNLVLPLLAAVQSWIAARMVRALAASALVVSAPAVLLAIAWLPTASLFPNGSLGKDLAIYAYEFSRRPAFAQPALLLEGIALKAVYPIVAPPASLHLGPRNRSVTLTSFRLFRYSTIVGIVSVVGWVALLVASAANAAVTNHRPHLHLLAAWLAFNLVFHTVWGNETLLYSPHWSWALFGVVLLGAGRLPVGFIAAACLATAAGQVQMIAAIKQIVATMR